MRSEVGGVRVDVHAAGSLRFGLPSGDPTPRFTYFHLWLSAETKSSKKEIHGVRVQPRHVDFQHRKTCALMKNNNRGKVTHIILKVWCSVCLSTCDILSLCLPAVLRHYHFICKILKFLPKLVLIQGHLQIPLRRVALLAAGLQLTLHRTEEVVHPVSAGLVPGALSSA